MAFGFGFGMPRSFATPFSPASLFATGAPGAWYDPSDRTTLFQDSAGTTPVTAVEQPVGLMLDKSQGLVLGPELVGNPGPFTSTTGWAGQGGTSISASGGALVVDFTTSTTLARASTAISCVVGEFHKVQFVINRSAGLSATSIAAVASPNPALTSGVASSASSFTTGSNVVLEFVFAATATTMYVGVSNNLIAAGTASIISATVRELPGNHAFQSTAASRPVLSARYNLLTKTEQFNDAVWTKTNTTVTSDAIVAPDGTITADRLYNSASTYIETTQAIVKTAVATQFTYSIYLKADQLTGGTLRLRDGTTVANRIDAVFSLTTKTVTASAFGTFSSATATIAELSDAWFRVVLTGTTGTETSIRADVYSTSTLNQGIYVWGASLVPANQSSLPYQRVNTATDYNTVGYNPYLRLDGVDDSLSTNSINFTSTDKMSVFAGVRKLSDAADAILTELSATVSTNNGSFAVLAPYSSTTNTLGFALRGSAARTNQVTGSSPYAAPITLVLAVRYDTAEASSAAEILPRVNGVVPSTSTAGAADSGTGNFGNYPLYIGRRNNATFPFNGQLYSMIIVGKAVQAGELSNSETYTASKTGVTLA